MVFFCSKDSNKLTLFREKSPEYFEVILSHVFLKMKFFFPRGGVNVLPSCFVKHLKKVIHGKAVIGIQAA